MSPRAREFWENFCWGALYVVCAATVAWGLVAMLGGLP